MRTVIAAGLVLATLLLSTLTVATASLLRTGSVSTTTTTIHLAAVIHLAATRPARSRTGIIVSAAASATTATATIGIVRIALSAALFIAGTFFPTGRDFAVDFGGRRIVIAEGSRFPLGSRGGFRAGCFGARYFSAW